MGDQLVLPQEAGHSDFLTQDSRRSAHQCPHHGYEKAPRKAAVRKDKLIILQGEHPGPQIDASTHRIIPIVERDCQHIDERIDHHHKNGQHEHQVQGIEHPPITMYFGGGLIPVYLLMTRLGLVNTLSVYWLPSIFSAYYMLLCASYIQNLPEALFEAARVDGASELRIFTQFIIPLSVPMLACISIYVGVGHWNSWFDVNLYSKNGTSMPHPM